MPHSGNFLKNNANMLLALFILFLEPSTLLTGEDRKVMFRVDVDCVTNCPISLELVKAKSPKNKIQARWKLKDDGLWGDKTAGDKTYSREISFKESRPKTLYFSIDQKEWSPLKVEARPTFLEILKDLWSKFKADRHSD